MFAHWHRSRLLKGSLGVGLGLLLCAAAARPGAAFDAGPHSDITWDALAAEGFGNTAIEVVQINNWFVDLYENASRLPHSGHAGFWRTLLGGGVWDSENWPRALVEAADRTHFDSTGGGFPNTAALTAEWNRLQRAVYSLARSARAANDPLRLLTVLGISLHQVQDFYAHTNWVEPKGIAGYDGPGWKAQGYGSTPTWFDLSAAARDRERIYAAGSQGIARGHGNWRSDNNESLATAMNKDWHGRPLYTEAALTAYFATRQWVQAVRSWVNDEAFWTRVRTYANRNGADLDHDVRGMLRISIKAGHWHGHGEPALASNPGPGGNLLDLRNATNSYFEDRGKTLFRRTWENYIQLVAAPNPPATMGPVPSSQALQQSHHFLRMRVTSLEEIDDMDLGALDQAEFYVRAQVSGQPFLSAIIHGYDKFYFPPPHAPFTFLKSASKSARFPEQLCNLRIEVATGDVLFAGTDDDVFFRINDTTHFKLDKPLYNDFERGDRDIYSCPVDNTALRIRDIRYLQIEKAPDGVAGGWRLGGIKVWANDRLIYENNSINRWLENNSRVWRAPNFTPSDPTSGEIPLEIALYEEDGFLYGNDDHCDIHPDHARKNARLLFSTGPWTFRGDYTGRFAGLAEGGDRYGGRLGDSDRARLRFQLDVITPEVSRGGRVVPDLVPDRG